MEKNYEAELEGEKSKTKQVEMQRREAVAKQRELE